METEDDNAILPDKLEIDDEIATDLPTSSQPISLPNLSKLTPRKGSITKHSTPRGTPRSSKASTPRKEAIKKEIVDIPSEDAQKAQTERTTKRKSNIPKQDFTPQLWGKIFFFLSPKEIAKVRLTCKSWKTNSQEIFAKLKSSDSAATKKAEGNAIDIPLKAKPQAHAQTKRKEKSSKRSKSTLSSKDAFFQTLKDLKNIHDIVGSNIQENEKTIWSMNVTQMRDFLDTMNVSFAEMKDRDIQLAKKIQGDLSRQCSNFVKLEEGLMVEQSEDLRKKQASNLGQFNEISKKLYSTLEEFIEYPNDRELHQKIAERIHALRACLLDIESASPFPTHVLTVVNDIYSFLASLRFIIFGISTSVKTKTEATINHLTEAMEYQISKAMDRYTELPEKGKSK